MLDGKAVRRLRRGKKITQLQLSKLTELTVQSISHIENGHRRNIFTDNLDELAKALDVEPAELLK